MMAFAARRDGTLSDLAEGEGSAAVTDAMCDVPEPNVKSRNALVVGIFMPCGTIRIWVVGAKGLFNPVAPQISSFGAAGNGIIRYSLQLYTAANS